MSILKLLTAIKGGSGSGNHGHSGRPGKVGGSVSSIIIDPISLESMYSDVHGEKGQLYGLYDPVANSFLYAPTTDVMHAEYIEDADVLDRSVRFRLAYRHDGAVSGLQFVDSMAGTNDLTKGIDNIYKVMNKLKHKVHTSNVRVLIFQTDGNPIVTSL